MQCASCSEYPRFVLVACFILWLGRFGAESRACCTFLMGFKFSLGARSSSRHIHRFHTESPTGAAFGDPTSTIDPQTSTTNRIKPACAVAVGQRMGQTKRRRNILAIYGKHVHTLKTHPDLPHLINVYTRFPHTRFTIYRGAILDMRFQDSPGRSWGLRKNLSGTSHIL